MSYELKDTFNTKQNLRFTKYNKDKSLLTVFSSLMIVLLTVKFCLFRYFTATCCR